MAQLTSPGVSVSVTDDSAYASTGQGTIPLFIIGTHEYKTTPSGSIASGTIPSSANVLQYLTSQRDLVQTFGNPIFYSNNGTPLDGYELNEYGLHAAYQYLGIADTAYAIRADIDYSQLVPSTSAPRGEPLDGTVWLDTGNTSFGIFQSNGNSVTGLAWDKKTPIIITDVAKLEWTLICDRDISSADQDIITKAGKLIINSSEVEIGENFSVNQIVQAINAISANTGVTADWQYLGGNIRLVLHQDYSTTSFDIGDSSDSSILSDLGLLERKIDANGNVVETTKVKDPILSPSASFGVNGNYAINAILNTNQLFKKIVNVVSTDASSLGKNGLWVLVEDGASINQNGKNITPVPSNWQIATQNCGKDNSTCNQVTMSPSYQIPANSTNGDVWVQTNPVNNGLNVSLKIYSASSSAWTTYTVTFYDGMENAPTKPVLHQIIGVYNLDNSTAWMLLVWNGARWEALAYEASSNAPTTSPEAGTYWFNPSLHVDIMVNEGGNKWVGYRNHPALVNTDPNGPIISGSTPTSQSTGNPLVDNDLWIDSSDTENYPRIYRYVTATRSWSAISNSDSVTPFGVIFADARQDNGAGSVSPSSLAKSDYVDPDAPNPELYPDGLLLFNTRYSTNNIKVWKPDYFRYGEYMKEDFTLSGYEVGVNQFGPVSTAGRWVTISGNNPDGSPIMGRKSQRKMIVQALAEAINSNQDVRSENIYFSLIAAPGYCELIDEMTSLTEDKNNVAFVVGDTPARLAPTGTAINSYANPTTTGNGNTEDSISANSPYSAVYYPWGKGTNVDGTEVVIPPSTIALRTIAHSDNVSYPWFPPAGFTRGLVSNASTVGYINKQGQFQSVLLNQGQRDVLYTNNINPIAYMGGQGLVVYGQKTRQHTNTALNRINVARLLCYLNYNLSNLVKPYLFELNNDHTRQSVQVTVSKFMADLMNKNAIYDYIVVCDTSNNTPDRIDNNELWIDIALSPEKAVEMIYVPIRIENTGTDLSSIYSTSSSNKK